MAQDAAAGDVNASGSQGVQSGSGNTQINNWGPKQPLSAVTLAALSPHAAVARIRQLPHDDAVDLFASAAVEDLTAKLTALLLADEATAVAILADLDPRKAAALISLHEASFPWLTALPKAAEAISQRAVDLKWNDEGRLERAARSPMETDGYFRQYPQGRVYWSDHKGNAYAVSGPVAGLYLASGGTGGDLGFPNAEEAFLESGEAGDGVLQSFEGGAILSSTFGTFSVSREVVDLGQAPGWPVSPIETHDGFTSQRFEDGVIYSSGAGTFEVRSEIAKCVDELSPWTDVQGPWFPVSSSADAGYSGVSGTPGTMQRFKNPSGMEMVVYSSEQAVHVHGVVRDTLACYERLGGPASWLGFPLEARQRILRKGTGWRQSFEGGYICRKDGHDPVAVPSVTHELAGDRLGWPVTGERPIGPDGPDRIQFFEDGVVTLRDGKREVWPCPQ